MNPSPSVPPSPSASSSTAPRTLADLVAVAARTMPTSGVVNSRGQLLPWAEIESQVVHLAHTLIAHNVAPGDRVAVLCPKSVHSFVSMHAVLAAGAIAVPLDPLGAKTSIATILEQIEPAAILGDEATVARLVGPDANGYGPALLLFNSSETDENAAGSESMAWQALSGSTVPAVELPEIEPGNPAYIIFTSGSTGRPKGILHSHRSGMAYARAAAQHHELGPSDRLAGTSPLHFDMSTLELYAIPLVGATAVTITEAELRFPASLSGRLEAAEVTHLYAVPFLLRQLQERGALADRDLTSLRHVGYAGEPFAPGALRELLDAIPQVSCVNLYGPAEVNVVTSHAVVGLPESGEEIPIGRPWPGVDIAIVDERGNAVPEGSPGELLVSAPTAMMSYWRLPSETAQRLIPRDQGLPPWYATGDVVSSLPDGTLRFLGRRDHQVKIRGVRLELEAIENVLTDAPGVEHAVVGVDTETPDGPALVAAVVLRPEETLDQRSIRRWCAQHLPAVAIPGSFVVLDQFPTTASGKIDRGLVRRELPPKEATTTPHGSSTASGKPKRDEP